MHNYRHLDKDSLLDLLAKHTASYTRTIVENGRPEELDMIRGIVLAIQNELAYRQDETNEETEKRNEDFSSPENKQFRHLPRFKPPSR